MGEISLNPERNHLVVALASIFPSGIAKDYIPGWDGAWNWRCFIDLPTGQITHRGKFLMSDCSRGAAGRNRPLNTNRLEKEQIPVVPTAVQKEVNELVRQENILKSKITHSIVALNHLRNSLITEAVTGQLDIKAWKKKGGTDKCLDNIEAEIIDGNLKRGAAC